MTRGGMYREIEIFITDTVADMIILDNDGIAIVPKPAVELQNWWTTHRKEILERYGHSERMGS